MRPPALDAMTRSIRRPRRVLALAALLAGVAALPAAGARQGATVVRVLTYNIHHGAGTDGRIDLARLAAVIRQAAPDVVALQEVDRLVSRSGGVDQASELARLTGLDMRFGRTISLQGGEYGNAVLSRWPIVETTNHPLPSPAGGEARALLAVTIALWPDEAAGPSVTFLATHFDHTRDAANRIASAEAIDRLYPWSGDPGTLHAPMVLAGDLNDVPDSRPIELLRRSWIASDASRWAPTSPAERPGRKIDYVMFRPASRWRVVESHVLDEPLASDHRPLLAVLELRSDR